MAQTVSVLLSVQDRVWLQRVVEDRRRPVKHVQRARIILLSADRLPVLEVAKRVEVSRPMVWRWQQRFAEEGVEGLLRDKTRPPGIPPVPQAKVHAVVERTLREPPGAVTHWTGRAMARAMGLSLRTSSASLNASSREDITQMNPHNPYTIPDRPNDPLSNANSASWSFSRRSEYGSALHISECAMLQADAEVVASQPSAMPSV